MSLLLQCKKRLLHSCFSLHAWCYHNSIETTWHWQKKRTFLLYSISNQPLAISATSCAKSYLSGFAGTLVLALFPSNGNAFLFYSPTFEMVFLDYGTSCLKEHFGIVFVRSSVCIAFRMWHNGIIKFKDIRLIPRWELIRLGELLYLGGNTNSRTCTDQFDSIGCLLEELSRQVCQLCKMWHKIGF